MSSYWLPGMRDSGATASSDTDYVKEIIEVKLVYTVKGNGVSFYCTEKERKGNEI